jgi:hypothetical protein
MDKWCEKMPMSTASNKERWYWPATFTVKDIHDQYKKEMTVLGHAPFQYDAFNKLLGSDFPHCRRADNSSEFKCSVCLDLTDTIKYYTSINGDGTWSGVIQQATTDKALHMEQCKQQRLKKEKHAQKAAAFPDKYGFLIADGMDQCKLWLPNCGGRKDLWGDFGKKWTYVPLGYRRKVRAYPTLPYHTIPDSIHS